MASSLVSPLQSNLVSDKRQRNALLNAFYIYLFVADVLAVVTAVWLSPFGLIVNVVLAFVLAYLTVVVGRWVLGRENL